MATRPNATRIELRTSAARGFAFAALLVVATSVAVAQTPVQRQSAPNTTEIEKSTPRANTSVVPKSVPAPLPSALPPVLKPSLAIDPAPIVTTTLRGIAIAGDARGSAISLDLLGGDATTLSAYALADPYRVVVDIDAATIDIASDAVPAGLVTAFRYGRVEHGKVRVVFDVAEPVRILPQSRVSGVTRFDLIATDPVTFARDVEGRARRLDIAGVAVERAETTKAGDAVRPVIMIDPGHGGADPGAVATVGGKQILEKDVVLAVSNELIGLLKSRGRYDVQLTRSADTFVSLARRAEAARTAGASLFISIHADTFVETNQAQSVRGASVYSLADNASNKIAQALADKENAADARGGVASDDHSGASAVRGILADLMQRETRTFSDEFRGQVIGQLRKSVTLAREPARAAAFRVLQQAETPSVLIELGYMSNETDAALLQSPAWQRQVADAVARAVDTYFAKPRTLAGR